MAYQSGCGKIISVYIPTGCGFTEVKVKCGSRNGNLVSLCARCMGFKKEDMKPTEVVFPECHQTAV